MMSIKIYIADNITVDNIDKIYIDDESLIEKEYKSRDIIVDEQSIEFDIMKKDFLMELYDIIEKMGPEWIKYSPHTLKISQNDSTMEDDCPICLGPLSEGEIVHLKSEAKTVLHTKCAYEYLKKLKSPFELPCPIMNRPGNYYEDDELIDYSGVPVQIRGLVRNAVSNFIIRNQERYYNS